MPDIIVALYADREDAENARIDLVRNGFATDRVGVASKTAPGPALHVSPDSAPSRFHAFFRTLLAKSTLSDDADGLAEQVERGSSVLIVHPRGRVELHETDEAFERYAPLAVRRDVRESIAPTPVVGEHAGGKR